MNGMNRRATLACVLLCLSACGTKKTEPPINVDVKGTNTVRGTVTHEGKPVPYGFVLLYHPEKSRNARTGQWTSVATSPIKEDGSYEVTTAPEGMLLVSVATDPDTDLPTLLAPSGLGGPPMAGGPPMMGGPPMLGGPPMMGGMPKGGPPKGGPPMGGFTPKDVPKHKLPKPPTGPPNPLVKNLSEEQKATLRELHKRYGTVGRSPLAVRVEGSSPTSYDIKLP